MYQFVDDGSILVPTRYSACEIVVLLPQNTDLGGFRLDIPRYVANNVVPEFIRSYGGYRNMPVVQ